MQTIKEYQCSILLESGDVVTWFGTADDINHATGQAIADSVTYGNQAVEVLDCYEVPSC